MSNFLPSWKIVEISDLLRKGHSMRSVQRTLDLPIETVRRYAIFGPEKCPCGKDAKHRGWCQPRVALSPGRQRFLESWTNIKPATRAFWKRYAEQVK